MSAKKSTKTFETAMKRLEEIVESLEDGSVPLESALELYEEGIELAVFCGEKLKTASIKLKKLSKSIDGRFGGSVSDE